MRKIYILVFLFLVIGITIQAFSQLKTKTATDDNSIDALNSPYLDRPFPGLVPKLFPPSELRACESWFWHGSPVFSPDGNEMYFVKMYDLPGGQTLEINYIKNVNGQWTEPQVPSFASTQYLENNPVFSEDGNTLYFLSDRSGKIIFKVKREPNGWSTPEALDISIPSSLLMGWQFYVVRNGTIYLELKGSGYSPPDIYRMKLENGRYRTPEPIDAVNTAYNEFSPYVDPEEKFMIFVSNRPGGFGRHDLYISFRNKDGTWSDPRNLGSAINSETEDSCPSITPDGKYFFFKTVKSGDLGYNPYWVDARSVGIISTKVFGHSDYDGDGRTDLAVFDPKTRIWHIKDQFKRKFGLKDSIPTPGDYDGDGRTDLAFYCPSKGLWKVKKLFVLKNFGGINDIPVPVDYDGDGKTDAALFNSFTGLWRIRESSASFKNIKTINFGEFGDIPVPGDYNGDGVFEVAVFRPAAREWIIDGLHTVKYGKGTDLPLPGDYDGDGTTDIATWDPFRGKWYVYKKFKKKYGKNGNVPVPGDYDGDGKVDIAVFESDTGLWRIRKQYEATHGKRGDIPLVKGN